MTEPHDLVVAGGGLAGLLCGARLNKMNPAQRLVVLEKEPCIGGRMRSTSAESQVWNYGLNIVSEQMFQFWDQVLKTDPSAKDLGSYEIKPLETFGVVTAGKMRVEPQESLFSRNGARSIAGAAAVRDWQNLEKLICALDEGRRKAQALQSAWSGTQKSPAVIALEHMARGAGVADIWSASTDVLFARMAAGSGKQYVGDWNAALVALSRLLESESSEVRCNTEVIGARYADGLWRLSTRQGEILGRKLIVAMPPWVALRWLPKQYWRPELLQMALKTKPVSAVILSEVATVPEGIFLPDRLFVPAENVQVIINPNGDICYQATIDFEVSLQAPGVVKAVRQVRRARKKLLSAVDGMDSQGDHLALVSVAWSQPTGYVDRRWIEKSAKAAINTSTLMFCGDAYCGGLQDDGNFIESLLMVDDCSRPKADPVSPSEEARQKHGSENY